jgi:hypothetical protein
MITGNFEGLGPIETEALVEQLDELERLAHIGHDIRERLRSDGEDAIRPLVKELGELSIHTVEASEDGDFKFCITQPANRFEISAYREPDGVQSEGWRDAETRIFPTGEGEFVFLANTIALDMRFFAEMDQPYAYPLGIAEDGKHFDVLRCKIGEMSVIDVHHIDELPDLVIPDTIGPDFIRPMPPKGTEAEASSMDASWGSISSRGCKFPFDLR